MLNKTDISNSLALNFIWGFVDGYAVGYAVAHARIRTNNAKKTSLLKWLQNKYFANPLDLATNGI
jgi:hypothetical protein